MRAIKLYRDSLTAAEQAEPVIGETGWVKVRINSDPSEDGWCFCTPENNPEDIERGLVEGRWNESEQLFAKVCTVDTPKPETATDEGPVAWLMNGKGDNWEERNVVTFDEETARMKADTEWWTVRPLFTSPHPDSRFREAFEKIEKLDQHTLYVGGSPTKVRGQLGSIAAAALAQGDDDERS